MLSYSARDKNSCICFKVPHWHIVVHRRLSRTDSTSKESLLCRSESEFRNRKAPLFKSRKSSETFSKVFIYDFCQWNLNLAVTRGAEFCRINLLQIIFLMIPAKSPREVRDCPVSGGTLRKTNLYYTWV
jgi:hypothetical protein